MLYAPNGSNRNRWMHGWNGFNSPSNPYLSVQIGLVHIMANFSYSGDPDSYSTIPGKRSLSEFVLYRIKSL
jgi:hypothetical protein